MGKTDGIGMEQNFTAINNSWRARIAKEKLTAQDFDTQFSYLVWKQTPTDIRRPAVSAKAKYFRGPDGQWTVIDKRIPVKAAQKLEVPTEEQARELLADPSTRCSATKTALMNHALVTAHNAHTSILHRPTSQVLGSRQSLEMFGVAQYGVKATRSKEPVGNGTKVYTT